METKPYCGDCPDPEACHQGASCDYVRKVAAYFAHLDAVTTGRGRTTMSNPTKATTKSPVDAVVEEAKEEKLVTEVPVQGGKDKQQETPADKPTGEKAQEVVEETAEKAKKTVKDRVTGLVEKAKENKKFFYGVVTGAISTAVVMAITAAEKVEEVVELTIADEPDPEVEGDDVTDEPNA